MKLRESQYIIKSLTALSDVITALINNSNFIPYKNSTLTLILSDAFKAHKSKVILIANINPMPMHKNESLSTLQFATKCRKVALGPTKRNIAYVEDV